MPADSSERAHAAAVEPSRSGRRQRRAGEARSARSRWRRRLSFALQVVAWTGAGLFAAIIAATVIIPRIIGAEPFVVVSGSMEPTIPTGSIVVSEHVDSADVAFGDVITYQLNSGQPLTVTHRVVAVDIVDDQTRYRTQGDANSAEDPLPVRPEQVRGVVKYHIPYIGYLSQLIPFDKRQGLATVLGIGLIGYAVITLIRAFVEHRKKSRGAARPANDRSDSGAAPDDS